MYIVPKYASSFVSNPRDEMNTFLMDVYELVKEEYRTTMLHYNMTLFRLIVYAQSIEESKVERRGRVVKRERTDEKGQHRFKKRGSESRCC